jgi:plasmid maintenance system antidote protein VapI
MHRAWYELPVSSRRALKPIKDELRDLMALERARGSELPTTIRQLAPHLGMDQAHLSRMLAGTRPLPADTIASIADVYGLPPDYFAEYRRARVIEESIVNPTLLDKVYDQIRSRRR